ncbi:phage/plasmid primase, P4 family [Clostridium sp. ZS1]|uniref:DNA primase family protein n=1 Tax=Clostridium sp. ZS1 TaxID=2949989 RepID=UPI002079340C|nr:phage/plasmid primase, P4 family [Clostridium sp. ZS1]
MLIKTVEEIVNEFIREKAMISECIGTLSNVPTLIKLIRERGDSLAYKQLKYHCNMISEDIFSSIMKNLMSEITIKADVDEEDSNQVEISVDDNLIEEIKLLLTNNMATALGFYYKKGNLQFNPNNCISYLQEISDIIIKNGVLMIYNHKQGIYGILNDDLLGKILRYLMNKTIPNSWKKIYEKDIHDGLMREVVTVDESYMVDENLIPLNNGVYDISNHKLLPHDKKYMFTSKSPIDFNEDAQCSIFEKAIREINCYDEELYYCLQEVFGNALLNNTKAEKAFFFTGVGSNGKSFCSEILTAILGTNNVSNIQLNKFSETFGIETIMGKKLNIANENEIGGAISTETLKTLVSGDTINISRKFRTAIDYKSTVKLIFLLNTLPDTLDNTYGYYRKILIIPFNRVFKPNEIDIHLKEKVCNELGGVLNWCLEGASRLISNGYKFTESKAVNDITNAYKQEQNPVENYLEEVLVCDEGYSETKKSVLDGYKNWLEGENISAKGSDSPQRFWKALNNASKLNLNKDLEYKKIKGTLYLNNFKIDHSKLPQNGNNNLNFVR